MFRKSFITLMIILSIVFLRDAFADNNFTAATPDALIILDLSGSMAYNPKDVGTYLYGADTSCVANTTACNNPSNSYYTYSSSHSCNSDTTNCPGSTGTTYVYGSTASCAADAAHASTTTVGCGTDTSGSYIYAHDQSCTANTSYCKNSLFVWDCSGGFCQNSHTNCAVNCDCSGGFCKNSKGGCAIDCNCQGGYCHNSKTGCSVGCASSNCVDGFCSTTDQSDCQTNCSKIEIAKRALAAIMDDAGTDNTINSNDDNSLGIRMGFMRFKDAGADNTQGNDTGGDPSSGNIKVVQAMGNPYSQIFCGNATSCSTTSRSCTSGECIAGASPTGGTPLMRSLREAKTYLDSVDNTNATCRSKNVILITDGADTFACGGGGGECDSGSYKRRRQSVAAAKALNDAGYKVYVIGFGISMPDYSKNTLNWMAYFGGTNNPSTDETDTGNTSAYDPTIGGTLTITDPTSCPSASSTTVGSCLNSNYNDWYAASNDPGNTPLSGYAFMTGDGDKLASYLKTIFAQIKASAFSFSQSSVQATRTKDENYIYEASFYPVDNDSFWIGHLKRFSIDSTTGNINSSADWDAGTQSSGQSADSRQIFTYKNGARTFFQDNTSYITNANLGLGTTSSDNIKRAAIFTFIRGGETNTVTVGSNIVTYTNWKLGDIYHFSPVTIGVPNQYWADMIDKSGLSGVSCPADGKNAYAKFYCQHVDRTSAGGKRIVLVGANDGQLHAFKAANINNSGGTEIWSFIPPNFLPSLQLIAHTAHPTTLTHNYFVDGSVGAFDVWWPNYGTDTTGTSKDYRDWHSLAVINEGRGGNATNTLWSNSSSCLNNTTPTTITQSFYSKYKDASNNYYLNYCGYWALDVTDTTALSTILWRMKTDDFDTVSGSNYYVTAAHLGDPWSKMVMGRVKINGLEKWVGFIGGGYSGNDCSASTTTNPCDLRGKSFYIVDVQNGTIIKKWTHSKNETGTPASSNNNGLDYDLASIAGIIDSDGDGFVDTAYIGDAGGNVWRIKLCLAADGASCNSSSWTMSKFFDSNNTKKPNYTIISSTLGDSCDPAGTWWLYFGTGDVTNPNKFNTSDKYFAVKDINRASSVVLGDLKDISASSATFNRDMTSGDKTYKGWYISLNNSDAAGDYGEKLLSNPTIFKGVLLFSTYTPKNSCTIDGDANIYAIDFNNSGTCLSGAGLFSTVRSEKIGSGVTSAPIVSYTPNLQSADVFISTSETASNGSLTQRIDLGSLFKFPKSKLLYWHDMRVQ